MKVLEKFNISEIALFALVENDESRLSLLRFYKSVKYKNIDDLTDPQIDWLRKLEDELGSISEV